MTFSRLLVALMLSAASAGAAAQAWTPQKNVELIVSTAPGGTNDKTARLLQRVIVDNKLIGSTLTVVNKPGAGGAVTNAYVNQHAGDAHYLFIGTPNLISQPILASGASYSDFTPVVSLFNDYVVMVVNAGSPIKSGTDFIDRVKANPQSIAIGFASALGNHHHITTGLVTKAVGGNVRALKLVVFKGSADAVTALLGNHIDVVSTSAVNAVGHRRRRQDARDRRGGAAALQRPACERADVERAGRRRRVRELAHAHGSEGFDAGAGHVLGGRVSQGHRVRGMEGGPRLELRHAVPRKDNLPNSRALPAPARPAFPSPTGALRSSASR